MLKRMFGRRRAPPAGLTPAAHDQVAEWEPGLNPGDPPMPGLSLRRSVGIEDRAFFDNPHASLAFGTDVEPELYRSVLDFGCGCGRIARQMLMQSPVPARYLGFDLYRPSIEWCRRHLTAHAPQFEFIHLDAHNPGLNPSGGRLVRLKTDDQFALVNAHSVFTHIVESEIEFYFNECVRCLEDGGVLRATWFLFDKTGFPMLQTFQNCLYVNPADPTNATIYDIELVKSLYARAGLHMYAIYRPYVRGHQWLIYARKGAGENVPFPADDAPVGLARPPVTQ
jgi:SAM-dependent methyltransferase